MVLARAVPIWKRTHAEIDGMLADDNAGHLRSNLRALS
jgi:hypothetical protein